MREGFDYILIFVMFHGIEEKCGGGGREVVDKTCRCKNGLFVDSCRFPWAHLASCTIMVLLSFVYKVVHTRGFVIAQFCRFEYYAYKILEYKQLLSWILVTFLHRNR